MKITTLVALTWIATAGASAQTAAPPKPAVKAVPKPSRVDEVIQLVKGGMTDATIVKVLQKTNKPIDLTTADLLKSEGSRRIREHHQRDDGSRCCSGPRGRTAI
jgi:hypothetical protein